MKIIPKGQNGLIVKSDNTRVVQQPIIFPIKYKLKPGETFVTDRNTRKKVLVKQKNEIVSADKRNTYRKQQDQKNAQQIHKQYEENKNQEEGMKNLQGFFNLISPSTYIGPVFNNNDKSYLDNVISGEGTGNIAGNIAVDLLTPLSVSKISKIVQMVPKTVGQKYIAPYVSSRIINRSINANPKGYIVVSENYFNSPNNWYRITNTPEVYGIKEVGKNVTTRDSEILTDVPSNNWRTSVLESRLTRDKEGFLALKRANKLGSSRFLTDKIGSAHGNTSQASKGQIWSGTIANSKMFPTVILEGEAARQVPMGITRSEFKLTPWEDIPMGQRIGFHTGEMPLDNLGYFSRLGNGKYSYQGTIIPDKRINIELKE